MSFCPNCGKELEGNPLFCPECGTYLMNAAAAQQSSAQVQQPQPDVQPQPQAQQGEYYQPPIQQQQPQQQQYQQYQQTPNYNTMPQQPYGTPVYAPQVEDKTSVGLAILSFFIPLVGWILFFTKRKKTPKAARVYGIVATVSFVLSVAVSRFGYSSYDADVHSSSIVCEAETEQASCDSLFI
ncbi:MAG: zinc-ribbon domain-containing protein [Eubacterium sp.]|nr:zinc-ribbon domain-containing protein [Eubacterium sp.]